MGRKNRAKKQQKQQERPGAQNPDRAPKPRVTRIHKPKVYLTQRADDMMCEVVRQCSGEVGGVGYCTVDDDRNITVDEVFLVPQSVSGAHVTFARDAMMIAMEKAIEDGRLQDLRFSWHSHGSMSCFWSGTDEGGIRDYLDGGAPWLLSMVVNHAEEYACRVDAKDVPIIGQATLLDLEAFVLKGDRTEGEAARQIEENVREEVLVGSGYGTGVSVGRGGSGKSAWHLVGPGATSRWKDEKALEAVEADLAEHGFLSLRDMEDMGLFVEGEVDEDFSLDPASALIAAGGFHIEDDEADMGLIAGKDGAIHDLTPHEIGQLRKAGYRPEAMSGDEILEAQIEIQVTERGQS